MNILIDASKFVLVLQPPEELPGLAIKVVQGGYESESLILLAGERAGVAQ